MHRINRHLISFACVCGLVLVSAAPALAASTNQPPNVVKPNTSVTRIVCVPSQNNNNSAFPFTATMSNTANDAPTCGGNFHWGTTVANGYTGTATWAFNTNRAYGTCMLGAYIPDNHAIAQYADYVVWADGNYLFDSTINQAPLIGYTWIGTAYSLNRYSKVTITVNDNNSNPNGSGGVSNSQSAAYAAEFDCW